MLLKRIAIVFLLLFPSLSTAHSKQMQNEFVHWLKNDLWPEARSNGISVKVFNRAFKNITPDLSLPDLVFPGKKKQKKQKQRQSEFRAPAKYFSEKSMNSQAVRGQTLLKKWGSTLKKIEKTYGVPGHFLLAIWARESAFGKAKIPYSAIRVLSTKAFLSTRKKLFRREILAALEILERGDISVKNMRSSWAGAMGQPQFLPSSYLKFAVDFDGDGKRDIWNSVPDTLASIAHYLFRSGWQKERDWGFESVFPQHLSCAQEGPDNARPISKWHQLGITRISGKKYPKAELSQAGMMLVPAGIFGPKFIVTPNFYVFKKYNNSDLYALYVGNLGDRIAYGATGFKSPFKSLKKLYRSEIRTLQIYLEKLGYDVGGADGFPGYKTRRSIGNWQLKTGRRQTCFPTSKLLSVIK